MLCHHAVMTDTCLTNGRIYEVLANKCVELQVVDARAANPWALGWSSVAALATAAAVIVAIWAWRIDAQRAKKQNAASLTVTRGGGHRLGTVPIAGWREDEAGVRIPYDRNNEDLQEWSSGTAQNENGETVSIFFTNSLTIKNDAKAMAYDVLITALDQSDNDAIVAAGGRPVYFGALGPGSTVEVSARSAAWTGGYDFRVEYRMEGCDWMTSSTGAFGKVRWRRLKNIVPRVRSARHRRQRQSAEAATAAAQAVVAERAAAVAVAACAQATADATTAIEVAASTGAEDGAVAQAVEAAASAKKAAQIAESAAAAAASAAVEADGAARGASRAARRVAAPAAAAAARAAGSESEAAAAAADASAAAAAAADAIATAGAAGANPPSVYPRESRLFRALQKIGLLTSWGSR